jgi:hypothetical protein
MSARRTHRLSAFSRWFRMLLLTTCAGCASDKAPTAAPCCEQPKIPAGVPGFKIVTDEGTGPSDGRKVILRAALNAPVKRDEVYPVLHTLYRHAMQRGPFEPIQFTGEVYPNESAAKDGGDVKVLARISRSQSQSGPQCDNRIAYDLGEQVARAFDASMGRLPQQDLDDTCRLATNKKVARISRWGRINTSRN